MGNVGQVKIEAGSALQLCEAILLQPDVVGWAHVVDAADLMPLFEKHLGYAATDEACYSGR
jgi:hypothetical protein